PVLRGAGVVHGPAADHRALSTAVQCGVHGEAEALVAHGFDLTFRTPQTVIKYIFLMVLWPLRGHNHRRIDVSQQEQGARVPRGSEVCRSYHPLSRRTPSTICPLSKPMPTNWGLSASSITTYLQKWRWTRARSCWGSCWIR